MSGLVRDTLGMIQSALVSVTEPRLYKSERGYQGELLRYLGEQLPQIGTLVDYPLVEQEYQKRLRDHGITFRPDIIIHCPFEYGRHQDRRSGNLAVFELKLRASKATACSVYERLSLICDALDYQLGIFINIDSNQTHYDGSFTTEDYRICSFAIRLDNGHVEVTQAGAVLQSFI